MGPDSLTARRRYVLAIAALAVLSGWQRAHAADPFEMESSPAMTTS